MRQSYAAMTPGDRAIMETMILACPTCDSRYDVSAYTVGQQLRCHCGTVMTRPAESQQAGKLACPQCGAGVSPNATKCEYCAAALLLKACPRCMSRVFQGYKHCPDCGAELDIAAEGTELHDMPCPRCEKPLRARRVGDIVIDECRDCAGLFLDQIAIKRVVTDRAQARAEALLGALPRAQTTVLPKPGQRMYVKCPSCKILMNRKLFAAGAGVIVDVCRAHGTFFDAGELPAIIEFVMQGGLEAAEKKEIERQRRQLEHEKAAVGGGAIWMPSPGLQSTERSGALVDLLFSLFG
jgi:Zn-finger nucleic acid-binding protein